MIECQCGRGVAVSGRGGDVDDTAHPGGDGGTEGGTFEGELVAVMPTEQQHRLGTGERRGQCVRVAKVGMHGFHMRGDSSRVAHNSTHPVLMASVDQRREHFAANGAPVAPVIASTPSPASGGSVVKFDMTPISE